MEADHMNELVALLEHALNHPPEQRPAILEKACGSDSALRNKTKDILAVYEKAAAYLGNLKGSFLQQTPATHDRILLGRIITFYEANGKTDTGNMKAVLNAYQEMLHMPKRQKRHNGYSYYKNNSTPKNGDISYKPDKRVKPLFDVLVDLSPDARETFLDRNYSHDRSLRRKVELLLAAYDAHDPVVRHVLKRLSISPPIPDIVPGGDGESRAHTLTGDSNVLHYQILEKLSVGSMSTVYKARDTRLDRLVVLKFLPPYLGSDDEARSRFIHEAKAASALDHSNICTIYDIGKTDDGRFFIVMPCYCGETLREKIERGPLPLEEVVNYAIQIAEGLSRTHDAGIIHRDVKPANLMVTRDSVIKILDFGLAKFKGASSLTKPGTTLGTVSYMSPEQARGETVDCRTDLWSFGVVMYEMLTGKRPFRGEYEQAVIYSILNEDPEPIAGSREEAPETLSEITNRLLKKDPEERYGKTSDLLTDLRLIRKAITMDTESEPAVEHQSALSVAVLPFTNMSADPAQEYFCDGISEELISALSQKTDHRVAARTSVFMFKNHPIDVHEIGRQLNVKVVLEGSVRKAGDRVRVTARLIDATDGLHLWSEQYDRIMDDTFTVQDELATTILQRLMDTPLSRNKTAKIC